MEFVVMLLAGFHWDVDPKVNPMSGHRISGTAAGWISLENKSHGLAWNFW
jgi:hypothetical protein